jgi:hypothetical protein
MKRFLFLLVIVFFPVQTSFAQLFTTVFDPTAAALLTSSGVAQATHYGQMVTHQAAEIEHFAMQVKHMTEQANLAVQNLKSAKDIRSWDDFMDFYNRQLYLEKMTMEAFDNTNITIGKKQYHLTDIEGMAHATNDTFVNYWYEEFTEEQEKEMWLGLGLTPSNYAYVQPFRAKARELTQQGLAAPWTQNEWYKRNMEKNKERQEKLAADEEKETKDKLGAKEIQMMILESLLETNKVMNDVAMNQALDREDKAVKDSLNNTPQGRHPPGSYPKDGFDSLLNQ